jgi:hypothetical protein
MEESTDGLSPDTLERLVARALELEESGHDRVSLARSRDIARELGISLAAWDAALAERRPVTVTRTKAPSRRGSRWRTSGTAAIGFAAGALGGWISQALRGDADVVVGAVLVLGALALAIRQASEWGDDPREKLTAWWLGVPAGAMLAFNEVLADPLWFAALAWLGSVAAASALPRLLRRLSESRTTSSTSTV